MSLGTRDIVRSLGKGLMASMLPAWVVVCLPSVFLVVSSAHDVG